MLALTNFLPKRRQRIELNAIMLKTQYYLNQYDITFYNIFMRMLSVRHNIWSLTWRGLCWICPFWRAERFRSPIMLDSARSPELTWTNPPEEVKSFVITVYAPDAPRAAAGGIG